jgi:hypothetical protein
MTLRAICRPNRLTNNVLLAMTMSASVILLGCGGGGGGGGGGVQAQPGVCGSPAGSVITVVCGRVVTADALGNAVAGATVSLTSSAGTVLSSTVTNSSGGYVFNPVPAGATLFKVEANPASFYAGQTSFNGGFYYYANQNQAKTGPCLPSLGALIAGDNLEPNLRVYSVASPPPPPLGCPR